MEELNFEVLFLFACLIEVIFQIKILSQFKKSYLSKDFREFFEINIIVFLSDILAYRICEYKAIGLSSAILCLFVCGFVFLLNLIVLISGLVIKSKIKSITTLNNEKTKKIPLSKSSISVLILNLLILLVVPILLQQTLLIKGKNNIVNYLEQKYGDGNYKIVKVMKEYNDYGMWDKYLAGYYYEVKTDYMKNTFIVSIDDKASHIEEDYFLPVYYSEKYNLQYKLSCIDWNNRIIYNFDEFKNYIINSIKDKYNIEIDKNKIEEMYQSYVNFNDNYYGFNIKHNYHMFYTNYGKIPSIDEIESLLIEYYN